MTQSTIDLGQIREVGLRIAHDEPFVREFSAEVHEQANPTARAFQVVEDLGFVPGLDLLSGLDLDDDLSLDDDIDNELADECAVEKTLILRSSTASYPSSRKTIASARW
jgi:hypothetical protein